MITPFEEAGIEAIVAVTCEDWNHGDWLVQYPNKGSVKISLYYWDGLSRYCREFDLSIREIRRANFDIVGDSVADTLQEIYNA